MAQTQEWKDAATKALDEGRVALTNKNWHGSNAARALLRCMGALSSALDPEYKPKTDDELASQYGIGPVKPKQPAAAEPEAKPKAKGK